MTNKTSTPARKTATGDELLRAYTIPDAAERLSLDERTFRRMIERGEIEVFYPRGKRGHNSPVRVSEQTLRDIFARTAV